MRILIYVPPEGHQIVFWNIGMHTTTPISQRPLTRPDRPTQSAVSSSETAPRPASSPSPDSDLETFVRLLARTEARRLHRRQLGIALPAAALVLGAMALLLALALLAWRNGLGALAW